MHTKATKTVHCACTAAGCSSKSEGGERKAKTLPRHTKTSFQIWKKRKSSYLPYPLFPLQYPPSVGGTWTNVGNILGHMAGGVHLIVSQGCLLKARAPTWAQVAFFCQIIFLIAGGSSTEELYTQISLEHPFVKFMYHVLIVCLPRPSAIALSFFSKKGYGSGIYLFSGFSLKSGAPEKSR